MCGYFTGGSEVKYFMGESEVKYFTGDMKCGYFMGWHGVKYSMLKSEWESSGVISGLASCGLDSCGHMEVDLRLVHEGVYVDITSRMRMRMSLGLVESYGKQHSSGGWLKLSVMSCQSSFKEGGTPWGGSLKEKVRSLKDGRNNLDERKEEENLVFTRGSNWWEFNSLINQRYITIMVLALKQFIVRGGRSSTHGESTPENGGLFGWSGLAQILESWKDRGWIDFLDRCYPLTLERILACGVQLCWN
ncbi:hypothetical protein L1987_57746 [Smallanthus sonchifolius]|uniref:Uncharacterized protein n=1 Tax=Smallanthus sonchifolius TaxID=185202 RepID=A0ACB9DED5_9ASTR|nr:hypothetical protein L1987_57746 [Smallanthus sonchifolius]